jgi:hypothetical protein
MGNPKLIGTSDDDPSRTGAGPGGPHNRGQKRALYDENPATIMNMNGLVGLIQADYACPVPGSRYCCALDELPWLAIRGRRWRIRCGCPLMLYEQHERGIHAVSATRRRVPLVTKCAGSAGTSRVSAISPARPSQAGSQAEKPATQAAYVKPRNPVTERRIPAASSPYAAA